MTSSDELRVIVLAPTTRDADIAHRLLKEAAMDVVACRSIVELLDHIEVGAAAVVMTDHPTYSQSSITQLGRVLRNQPPWSELPIIALARAESASESLYALRSLPGLVLLERPVNTRTLLSSVSAAIRGRLRQYAMREQFEKLRIANDELNEAARTKDEFLATLAHELRNPLNAISTSAQVLKVAATRPRALEFAIDVIGRQVGQMSRLLDDLLDVSRITRNRMVLRKDLHSVSNILNAAIETARPLIDQKRHLLTVNLPDKNLFLMGDAVRIAQVLSNLLTNAAKYTEPAGRIAIKVMEDGEMVAICVSDTGIGIPQHSIHSIFDMFAQLRPAIDRSDGGLGIGLALAKGIVDLHGGTLSVTSDGENRGSEFVVRLPLAPCDVTTSLMDKSTATSDAHTEPQSLSRRVLIADDNADSLQSLTLLLQAQGHTVFAAKDGGEAIRLFEQHHPEFALLDIGMPVLNGYEVAQQVRSLCDANTMSKATLIAVTGWGQPEDKRKALAAGFDHHVTKPVGSDILRSLLNGVEVVS
ncbi:MAG TPA: hybrid sensor histidine kinase/response regulator [Steroidobacteraceae bacterium]|nr:hybrid sensor histidine kinase/response regulator [Steroidobacteraceae bacterium]